MAGAGYGAEDRNHNRRIALSAHQIKAVHGNRMTALRGRLFTIDDCSLQEGFDIGFNIERIHIRLVTLHNLSFTVN